MYRCGVDGDVDVWDATDLRALASAAARRIDAGLSARDELWLAGRADGSVCVYALGVNARGRRA